MSGAFASVIAAINSDARDERDVIAEAPARDAPGEHRPRGLTYALSAIFRVRRDMGEGQPRRSLSRRITTVADLIRGMEIDMIEAGFLEPWDGINSPAYPK